MGSPWPMLGILCVYIYFVKVAGPAWMRGRAPFRISGVLIGYNVLMVLLSALFFWVGGRLTYLPGGSYDLVCEPVDYSPRPPATTILRVGWWFLLLKLVELLDTVFFVLRKKFTHVSALHVTHHSLVAWGVWIGLKFGGGGHSSFFPILNCAVHMLMYAYYAAAALGPAVRRFLWWKRYLTMLQMVSLSDAVLLLIPLLPPECAADPVHRRARARLPAAVRGLRLPALLRVHAHGARRPLLGHVLQLLQQELQPRAPQQQPAAHPDSSDRRQRPLSPTSHLRPVPPQARNPQTGLTHYAIHTTPSHRPQHKLLSGCEIHNLSPLYLPLFQT